MPFDGTDFPKREDPPSRGPDDNAATVIIILLAFCLLAMPISLACLVDIVRYLRSQ